MTDPFIQRECAAIDAYLAHEPDDDRPRCVDCQDRAVIQTDAERYCGECFARQCRVELDWLPEEQACIRGGLEIVRDEWGHTAHRDEIDEVYAIRETYRKKENR